MNNKRRAELQAIIDKLEELRGDLDRIIEEEDSGRDNMPESLQASEAHEKSETASDSMTTASDSIGDAVDNLYEAKGE